ALVAIVTLVVGLVAGQFALPYMLFLAPGLGAKAYAGGGVQNDTSFQGFVFDWDRLTAANSTVPGGYDKPDSLKNMSSQANDFHMNAVIIPVYMDMAHRSDSALSCDSRDRDNQSTLPDADYNRAIQDALKAGLVPILELRVRVAPDQGGSDTPDEAGVKWSASSAGRSITAFTGSKTDSIGNLERGWFDKYTACTVRFAQMSKQHNLPFFIIGDGLSSVTYDTDSTNAKADPNGLTSVAKPGDPCTDKAAGKAAGRRECEWRHVVHAIKSQNYPALNSNAALTGAAYTGKLIYAASWTCNAHADLGGATQSEFDHITWWDAVDFIGVDANFPLTKDQPDAPVSVLMNAWKGQGPSHASGNIYQSLANVSDSFQRAVVFTGVQYASAASANTGTPIGDSGSDEVEQLNDVQALIKTFSDASWWAGVFWDGDQPIAPRSNQKFWDVSSNWAGDNLEKSKQAGKWLASYYHDSPLQCPSCK
ncbi:MAG TPA: hypothetical protein VF510_15000, partial [Ktedonobacterales bacterium]